MSQKLISSFINGEWVQSAGERLPVVNPATEETIAYVVEASAEETAKAIENANDTFLSGVWSGKTVKEKQEVFAKICELTLANIEELAQLECSNAGLPYAYLKNRQLPRIVRNFKFFSDYLSQNVERSGISDEEYLRFVVREPIGVVALISPWNAPLALASTKIAAALAFGNSCVVKTAEQTPLAVARFMEILVEAGVPAGVVNMVNGRGQVTGEALSTHPLVQGISFTGGTATGKHIASRATPFLKRVDLELGGKSANIIMDDADLDLAVKGSLSAIYTNNGQQCFAGSRILVQRNIADEFIARFVEGSKALPMGDPLAETTQLGPLANERHYANVKRIVEKAVADGAQLLCGGEKPENMQGQKGYYLAPTAFLVKDNAIEICQEEIFGPVVTIQVFDSYDEALEIANDSRYGLVCYLWTTNLDRMTKASLKIKAGVVLVNTTMILDSRFPFSGHKESGMGREGIEGFKHFYTEEKTVTIAIRNPDAGAK
ncbi:MAG: aldehyde dehydrogenase [Alcaligenaceae bacterium]|nr:aldehyde dehydrogenase [Alcaligenaceae bacterium]